MTIQEAIDRKILTKKQLDVVLLQVNPHDHNCYESYRAEVFHILGKLYPDLFK
jgi:hypothetical protein